MARSLSELRERWRDSAIRAFGACVVYRLAERAWAAAAAVWARVRPVVDVALAAVDTVAVVYVMRGAFKHRHLLAEARRHLSYVLRGRRHEPGLDEQIVQAAVEGYTRPIGRMMTADLRALYPREIEDQAVVRPLTRTRSKSRWVDQLGVELPLTPSCGVDDHGREAVQHDLALTLDGQIEELLSGWWLLPAWDEGAVRVCWR